MHCWIAHAHAHAHARARARARALGVAARRMSSSGLNRPSPPPLPRELQREFEQLQRQAQAPLSSQQSEEGLALHPDARTPLTPEFEGPVNPKTGEEGGPKREPVAKWAEDGGDWSFKGRVTDF